MPSNTAFFLVHSHAGHLSQRGVMSKGKKKPQPPQRAKAASKDARPNLFEHLYNRKKFNVLGKKEPGIKKHGKSLNDAVEKVGQLTRSAWLLLQSLARSRLLHGCILDAQAHTQFCGCLQRKKTLLVEYRQLRKANAFVDRRFGEDNEGLTPEEKAIVRFQKQRMSQAGGRQLQSQKCSSHSWLCASATQPCQDVVWAAEQQHANQLPGAALHLDLEVAVAGSIMPC